MSIDERAYISPDRIAHELDVDHDVVRRWIRAGELRTVKVDHFVRVPVPDYQAFLRRKLGVPRDFHSVATD
jgi:hypothetical protein